MWNQQREAFVWSQQGTRLGFPRRDNGEGEVVREEEQGCGLIKMCILSGRFKISLENIKVQRLASPIRPKASFVAEKKRESWVKATEERMNWQLAYISACHRLPCCGRPSSSSEVIQKKNVSVVIFYRNIKAVKAGARDLIEIQ